MKTVELNVLGMHCMGCANGLGRSLERKPGVDEVQVTVEDGYAKVVFDEEVLGVEEIIAAIKNLGYEAQVK